MSLVGTEAIRFSDVVKYEQESSVGICRDVVTVYEAGAKTYPIGTVLGKTLTGGSATATAGAGNTGTGTVGTITVSGTAEVGTYTVRFVKAVTDKGDFVVTNPAGVVVGVGSATVVFTGGGLSFTISDATDFVVGDTFTIAVTGTVKYKMVEATATDGSAKACAVYISGSSGDFTTSTIAATTNTSVIALIRGACIVGKEALTYGASINTDAEKAQMYAELESVGIICRSLIGTAATVA